MACAPGLHVSPDGHDQADGSASAPFATLARAQHAARQAGAHVIILDPGTQHLTAALALDARDDGLALIACPAGAVLAGDGRLPVLLSLDGASDVRLQDVGFTATPGIAVLLANSHGDTLANLNIHDVGHGVVLSHSGGNSVTGSRIAHVASSGIEAKDGSDGNRFVANMITDIAAHDTTGGGIFLHGASDNLITRNLVAHTEGMGIGVSNWDQQTVNTGNVVSRNIVRDVDRGATDSGAIYVLGRSQRDTRMVIADNLVDGAGPTRTHTVGIYLDDSTSGVSVHGNILRRLGAIGVQVHGGSDNHVERNIIDLGDASQSAMLFQSAPADTRPSGRMVGNVVRHNAIVWAGRPKRLYDAIDGGRPVISGNVYVAQAGASRPGRSRLQDEHPIYASAGDAPLSRLGLPPLALSQMGPPDVR